VKLLAETGDMWAWGWFWKTRPNGILAITSLGLATSGQPGAPYLKFCQIRRPAAEFHAARWPD